MWLISDVCLFGGVFLVCVVVRVVLLMGYV